MSLTQDDRPFLDLCEAVKLESHDPHRQVGSIIVSKSGEVLATGSNAPPKALHIDVRESHSLISDDPNWKYYMLEHAERNAIKNARESGHNIDGATMYGTLFPCADCARAIVAAGIKRLVVPPPHSNPARDQKWATQYQYAEKIFALARTQVDLVYVERAAQEKKHS